MRQSCLRALVEQYAYPQSLIGVEVPIKVGAGVEKRCDAVVYSPALQPLVHAPYLILSNGKQTVVAQIDADRNISFLTQIPTWNQLLS